MPRRPGSRSSRRQLRTRSLPPVGHLQDVRRRPAVDAQGEAGGAQARRRAGEEERVRRDQRLPEERRVELRRGGDKPMPDVPEDEAGTG